MLGGLFWIILASLLSQTDYGQVNYYIALASVFSAIALMGLDTTVITYLAKGEWKILLQANSLTLISGLTATVVLSLFHFSSGLLSFTMVFFMMTLADSLGKKKYNEYAILSIGQRIAQIVLSLLLYFQFGLFGIVFGYFFGNLIFSYRYLKFIPHFTKQMDKVKEKKDFAMHSYGFNLIRNFTNYLDKIVIGPLFGFAVLGQYTLGFQFFLFLSIIPLSLYYYLLPEQSSGRSKNKIKIFGIALSVAAAVIVFFAAPILITTLFSGYIAAIPAVQVMCFAVIPSTISSVLNACLLGKGESKTVLIAGLIYLISLVILLIILGQTLGALGLAITLTAAQCVQALYLVIKRQKT